MDLTAIQAALRDKGIDGWLFCDFHNRDHLAYRILGLDFEKMTSRRWFFFVPADGEPVKLAHRVESTKLDELPGRKVLYHPWEELHASLREILGGPKTIAMQYSPLNNIPYTSIVDGGTIELVRSFGHEVVSSADLVQLFEAIIDDDGYESHIRAGDIIQQIKNEAFSLIGKRLRATARSSPSTTSPGSSSTASRRRASRRGTTSRSSASTIILRIPISSRRRKGRTSSRRGTRSSSTSGASSRTRDRSTTTSPGAGSSGTSRRRSIQRYSMSSAMPGSRR